MTLTKAHARIAADMLSEGARGFLTLMKRDSVMGMSEPAKELQDLGFIVEKSGIWRLTGDGKKVSDEL